MKVPCTVQSLVIQSCELQGTDETTEADYLVLVKRPELSGIVSNKLFCEFAAARGWLTAVQWLRQHGTSWDEGTCSAAAKGGHLAVLQWSYHNNCPWNAWTCSSAARWGHLAVLQWARQQTPPCPWNEATCSYAAQGGHLMLLQWARQHARPLGSTHLPTGSRRRPPGAVAMGAPEWCTLDVRNHLLCHVCPPPDCFSMGPPAWLPMR